jgi:hypothetical protein
MSSCSDFKETVSRWGDVFSLGTHLPAVAGQPVTSLVIAEQVAHALKRVIPRLRGEGGNNA